MYVQVVILGSQFCHYIIMKATWLSLSLSLSLSYEGLLLGG
jgi:hypothetical protein